jgi:hypothetical protein
MTDLLPLDPKRDVEAVLRLHAELSLAARSTFEQFGFDVVEQQTSLGMDKNSFASRCRS